MNIFNSTILECPICLVYYEEPRILTSCGHTLCTKCIIDIISTNSNNIDCFLYIDCPTCSETTKIENSDISSLKINYTVSSIIDSLIKKKTENTSLSTSCPESIMEFDENEIIYVEKTEKTINKFTKNIDIAQTSCIINVSKSIDIPTNNNEIDNHNEIDNIIIIPLF